MRKEINILFTSIYNKVSLVRAFQSAYKKLKIHGKVVTVDINPFSAGLHIADKGYTIPRLDNSNFLSRLIEICQKEKVDLVVPTRDEDLPFFAKCRNKFNTIGIKLLVSPFESIKICQDKLKFYHFLKDNDLPYIKTWTKIDSQIKFPCITKPKIGKAANGFCLINNKNQLTKIDLSIQIIQEKINGAEYTIDYFADFEANVICVIPRIRYKVVDGESKIGITKDEPDMVDLTKKLCQKLKLIGHNTIQCFRTESGEIKFLEINPRFGGGAPLGFVAGCKSPEWILQLLQGTKIKSNYKIKKNLVMIRHSADIFLPYDKINNL